MKRFAAGERSQSETAGFASPAPIPARVAELVRRGLLARASHFSEIASTNDFALAALRAPGASGDAGQHEAGSQEAGPHETGESFALPWLVSTDRQTRGRGRGAHAWWSADGALTFSYVFAPETLALPVEKWSAVALVAAVAVCDVLDDLLFATTLSEGAPPSSDVTPREHSAASMAARRDRAMVKWPNDVWVGERKICGILVERAECEPVVRSPFAESEPARHAGQRSALVVGVGINVANRLDAAPPDVRARAVSLCELTPSPLEPSAVLADWLERFSLRLGQWARDDNAVITSWQERCALTGRAVVIDRGSETIAGIARGLGSAGELLLQLDTGRIEPCYGGTVTLV